jgi:hypothetical protein
MVQGDALEKTVELALEKLLRLKVNNQLISELEWCLGSYKADRNPVGLIEKSREALELLKEQKEKSSRTVSKKLIDDLEKVGLAYS